MGKALFPIFSPSHTPHSFDRGIFSSGMPSDAQRFNEDDLGQPLPSSVSEIRRMGRT